MIKIVILVASLIWQPGTTALPFRVSMQTAYPAHACAYMRSLVLHRSGASAKLSSFHCVVRNGHGGYTRVTQSL